MTKKPPINLPDRYIFSGRVLQGGQGTVYVCKDQHLDRDVAFKMMQDIDDISRLLDEISALQSIRSKHVVEIYDIIIEDKKKKKVAVGIIEEFLPGNDLWDYNETGSSDNDIIQTLYQIASGISEIHIAGIIHRDIKPNNMKFNIENLVKIYDFGLARKEGVSDDTIGFKGTHGFAAPELYAGGNVKFTKKIDVFAFGASAWILLAGTLPSGLKKKPPVELAESIHEVRSTLPAEISEIIDTTLNIDPDSRPTMGEVRHVLSRNLLYGRHRGMLRLDGKVHTFSKTGQSAELTVSDFGSMNIEYTGLVFVVRNVNGQVYVNNAPISDGFILPGSCVITFGDVSQGARRRFVTFDISHPEVIL